MRIGIVLLLTILIVGCAQRSPQSASVLVKLKFESVVPPAALTDPAARADYMAKHFWDKFNFSDTAYVNKGDVTEQAFSNYLAILPVVGVPIASQSLKAMMDRAQADSAMYAYFTELTEKYLYDPNSPMRNEELFIPVLEHIIGSPAVDEIMKLRPATLLEMAMKNRPGSKATDFTYQTVGGKQGRLYDIKADYTVLFFNNPGCHACGEYKTKMLGSPMFTKMVDGGVIEVLGVYSDEEFDKWRESAADMPRQWINSCDPTHTLSDKKLYDLKAIPTLYLLDRNKTVLLKDVVFEQIDQYLQETTQQ